MNRGEEKPREDREDSPTESQQTVSDDDEIDYSIKPEFYDPKLDDKDELWVQKKRKGHTSDAVLSCPGCFTTLCLDCQRDTHWTSIASSNKKCLKQGIIKLFGSTFTFLVSYGSKHEKYLTQYRAVFVVNCKIKSEQVSQSGTKRKRKRSRKHRTSETEADSVAGEAVKRVCCSVCSTEVGVIDEEEVYHFFNVLPSEP